ncbi:MAG TPA: hypothetical protein DCK98_04380 [Chloroflexi bacterium]|nr:hypothetical protein [Chloroflexota bacterium]HAL27605.1 hypothetical protein [Chloroflexota bacterium]
MIYLGLIALVTLAANSATRLRVIAVAFVGIAAVASVIAATAATGPQVAVSAVAGLAAAGILFVAARDNTYGEDPGWRLWLGTFTAAIVTPLAYASFRTVAGEPATLPLFQDGSGVVVEVAGTWLLSSGVAIMLTARSAVRMSLAALVLVTGVQLLARLAPEPRLATTLALAWLEVVAALAGAFLIVNERAVRDA